MADGVWKGFGRSKQLPLNKFFDPSTSSMRTPHARAKMNCKSFYDIFTYSSSICLWTVCTPKTSSLHLENPTNPVALKETASFSSSLD